jgi:sugar lactone lactonase YvrE
VTLNSPTDTFSNLTFGISITGNGNAPALGSGSVRYTDSTSNTGLSGGGVTSSGTANDVGVVYQGIDPNDDGNPELPVTAPSQVLGTIKFTLPPGAGAGQSYAVTLTGASGYDSVNNTSTVYPNLGSPAAISVLFGPTSLVVGSGGGTFQVFVNNSGAWTAASNSGFLHVTAGASDTGNATVVFTCDADASTGSRSGTLTIAGNTLTVTQAGTNYVAPGPLMTLVSATGLKGSGVFADGGGNVYFTDNANNLLEEWNVTTAATTPAITNPAVAVTTICPSLTTCAGAAAFSGPTGVAEDGVGNVYFSDSGNNAIKEWLPSAKAVNTLVSTGLSGPVGLALDPAGNIYFADSGNNAIKKWTASNQQVSTLVSSLNGPTGVAVDAQGNVYFADTGNNAVKEWVASSQTVTSLVSTGLNSPEGVAVDVFGNVYIADKGNGAVKEWNAQTLAVSTLVSSIQPVAVSVDGMGNLYIGDNASSTISELPNVYVGPASFTEPPAAANNYSLLTVIPSTQSLAGVFKPTSNQTWLTIGTISNGVVDFNLAANTTTSAVIGKITLYGQQITVTQTGVAPPTATCATITAVQNVAITAATLTGSAGVGGPYTFSATGLPSGLSISSSGVISGTPTVNGTFPYVVTIKDSANNSGTLNCSITVNGPPSATCPTISAVLGNAVAPVTLTGTGGFGGPYTFSATGLPSGMSISSSGLISGTPTVTGTFPYTVTITDSQSNQGTLNCSVTVAAAPTSACPTITAVQGNAITPVTLTGTGGVGALAGAYTFSATGLPTGLSISSSGVISGTPTVNGTFPYVVTIKDSANNSGTLNCSVTVSAAPSSTCPTITAVQGNAIANATLTGSGGVGGPYTFSATGLPTGLSISTSGVISGTPTASGTFPYVVTITDSANNTGTLNCSITVNGPPTATCPTITAVQGNAITNATLTGSGGVGGPYSFSATGLPTGLSISTSGVISGTPTVNGTFPYTVTIKDSANNSGTLNCSITVNTQATASCPTITAVQNNAITPVTLTASAGAGGPYTFSATGLPTGVSISSSGVISGTPTVNGTFPYTVTITDKNGDTGTLNCSVTVGVAPSATCATITAVQGNAITPATLTGAGGAGGPYTFSATGLPNGLSISSSGAISGAPTVNGTFPYVVTIKDSANNSGTLNCSVTVSAAPSATCPTITAVQGAAIANATLTGSGGVGGPYTFSATGLPGGLSISTSGVISGTPTASGTFPYVVTIKDSANNSGTLNCSITVNAAPSANCPTLNAVLSGALTPVTLTGSGGVGGPYTFSATGLPTGLSISSSGVISGTPTVSGTFPYVLTVKDSAGDSGTVNCSVTVSVLPTTNCPTVTAVVGVAIAQTTLVGAGGSGSGYSFSATGLPTGITLSSAGVLSGAPSVTGTFSYTITIKDSANSTGTVTCSITVAALPTATCPTIPAVKSIAITPVTLTGSAGAGGPYTFSATGLPTGLSISSSGVISGTATVTGTFPYVVTIKDSANNSGTLNCSVTVAATPTSTCPTITAVQGNAITNATLTGSGGLGGPYTFSATGLPAGVTISTAGVISGTPTANGTFPYVVTISDFQGNQGTLNCSVTVLAAPSSTCPTITAVQGTAITNATLTGSGGVGGPYTFSATGLPTGLSISTAGVISGTPTVNGTFPYTVTIKDSANNSGTLNCSVTVSAPTIGTTPINLTAFSWTIGAPVPTTTQTLTVASGNTAYSAAFVQGTGGAWLTISSPTSNPVLSLNSTVVSTLTTGTYTGKVEITDATATNSPFDVSVSLSVSPQPNISTTPTNLTAFAWTIGSTIPTGTQTLTVSTGNTAYTTAFSFTSGGNWLTVTSGTSNPVVQLNAAVVSTLTAGTYLGNVVITDSLTGNSPFNVPVSLVVTAPTVTTSTPAGFTYGSGLAVSAVGQTLTVNSNNTAYTATFSQGTGGAWLTITSPTSNPVLTLNAAVVSTLAVSGTPYSGTVVITDASAANSPLNVPVSLTVSPALVVTPLSVPTFSFTAGGTPPTTTQTLTVNSSNTAYSAAFATGGGGAWLTVTSPTSNPVVSLNAAVAKTLGAGSYSGAVVITDAQAINSPVNVPVSLSIAPAVTLTVSQLNPFTWTVGTAVPTTSQTLTVTAGGTSYTASFIGVTGGQWLNLASPSSNPVLTLNAAVVSTLAASTTPYSGNIEIIDPAVPGSPFFFPVSLVVSPAALTITTTSLPAGVVNVAYNQTLASTGGATPITWAVTSGALPGGIALSSSGALTGTPTTSGTFPFAVKATDSGGNSTSPQALSILINPALTITTKTLPNAIQGVSYQYGLAATGGTGTGYAWTVSVGSLPTGISLSSSGLLSGNGTATAPVNFTVKVTDSGNNSTTQALSLAVNLALSITTTSPLPFGVVGQAYSTMIAAQGGALNYTFSVSSGTLPPGLGLVSNGSLKGNPSLAGTYNFTIQVSDGVSPNATLPATLIVYPKLTITTTSLPNGTVGTAYTPVTVAATGGSGSQTWSATGLPAGLSIAASTGVIGGTPSATGTSSASITATDATSSQTANATLSITIVAATAALQISPSALVVGAGVNQTVSGSFTASGGKSPYSFAVTSGSLPTGVTLSSAGALSGSASSPGNKTVTVTLTDAEPATTTASLTVNVLGLTTASPLPAGAATLLYQVTFSAAGGTPSYTFSSSGLPSGFSISGSGVLTGTPSAAGTLSFPITVTDKAGLSSTSTYSLTVGAAPLSVPAPSLANGTVGTAYSQSLTATGGKSPYTWTLVGAGGGAAAGGLPPGLSLSSSGVIAGNPTSPGTYTFGVQAMDANSAVASSLATITIQPKPLTITTTSLPSGVVGFPYPVQVLGAGGGVGSYKFAVTNGGLPSGLSLAFGAIYGTPSAAGPFPFTITVTDSAGTTAQANFTITVTPPASNLQVLSSSVNFSITSGATTAPPTQTVGVQSTGSVAVGYTVSLNPAAPWLNSIPNGTTPSNLNFSLSAAGLAEPVVGGPYQTQVTLTCTTGTCVGTTQSVTVTLNVTAPPPALDVVTTVMKFVSDTSPEAPETLQLVFGNSGGGTLNVTSVTCGAPWCTVGSFPSTLAGGSGAFVNITADPTNQNNGFYKTSLQIVTSAGSASVPVTFFVSQIAIMSLAPEGATFTMPQGGAPGNPNGSFQVSVTAGTTNWTASVLGAPSWLTLSNTSGSASVTTSGTVNFSINHAASGLLANTNGYYATIRVTASGVVDPIVDFDVVLSVTPTNNVTLNLNPGGMVFLTTPGGTPTPQTVTVYTSASTATAYSAQTLLLTGSWLGVGSASGTASASTPGQTSVTINTAGLGVGVYGGFVLFSMNGVSGVPYIPVTLLVLPTNGFPIFGQPATTASATNGAGGTSATCTPTTLIPTEIGLSNNFSVPAFWPAQLSIFLVNDCGLPVSNASLQATFSNGDAPLSFKPVSSTPGLYSATWTPQTAAAQVTVSEQAALTGLPAATTQLSGAVTPNTAPSLAPNATALLYNGQVGAALAPGSIVSISGSNLASATVDATTTPLPTSLGGTSVTIGGIQAPLYYVEPTQILAQIPSELTPGQQYQVVVNVNGAVTPPQTIQIASVSPAVAANTDGTVIAQHWDDGSLVTAANPAVPGEYLVLYLVGMGAVNNPVADGVAAPLSPLSTVTNTPVVTLGSTQATVLFAGLTPQSVGLYQIDIQMPSSSTGGNVVLSISQGSTVSNSTILPVGY